MNPFVLIIVVIFFILLYLIFNQDKLIFHPEKIPIDHKFSYDAKEIVINKDGGAIYALHFQLNNPKGTILYFHGNAGSLRDWGSVAKSFTSHGWNVLMTDYRGFGKSDLPITEDKLYEDAMDWYKYLQKEKHEIIIYGRSIGTGVAIDLASRLSENRLILETPFTSLPDVVKDMAGFLHIFVSYKFDNMSKIRNISPIDKVYLVHGTNDEIISHNHSLQLYSLNKGNMDLLLIKGGNHNNLSQYDQYKEYIKKILS